MPEIKPVLALGTVLSIGNADGPPETYTAVAQLTTIDGPQMKVDTVDVSNMDTNTNTAGFKEKIPGLADGGAVALQGNWLPGDAGQTKMLTAAQARTVTDFKIADTSSPSKTWTFSAIITALAPSFAHNKQIDFKATLEITGKPIQA